MYFQSKFRLIVGSMHVYTYCSEFKIQILVKFLTLCLLLRTVDSSDNAALVFKLQIASESF